MASSGTYLDSVAELQRARLKNSSKIPKSTDTDNPENLDFDLLRAQLSVAKAAQELKHHDFGHGLGVLRHASLASHPTSRNCSTPDLDHDIRTPSDDGSAIFTPGYIDPALRANLKRALHHSGSKSKKIATETDPVHAISGRTSETPSQASWHTKLHYPIDNGDASSSATGIYSGAPSALTYARASPTSDVTSVGFDAESIKCTLTRSRSHSLSSLRTQNIRGLRRTSSLPNLRRKNDGFYSYFTTETPARDLVIPAASVPVEQKHRKPHSSEDTIDTLPAVAVVDQSEKKKDEISPSKDEIIKKSLWARSRDSVVATYAPKVPPALILPSGPTDEEKLSYLKTNRVFLYSFGVFSFLSLSAGMWLFVVSALPFYWFGLMVVLLQAYLCVSYAVSIVGKDFDYEGHKKIIEENPVLHNSAPTVDIYLPCCKEPIEVLENTYKHIAQLQYPAGKLKVYVLDDGADDAVKVLAAQYGFNYICREDRPRLKKAGNLRWAFARTDGDFFTIYDADFCPRPDFLLELIPEHLANPKAAIIQTPQFFRVLDNQTWVEQGAGAVQELFYRVIQVNRNRWGASICVGSNAVYRREALVEVGGTAEIGFSEDVHTGFYALTRGWQVRYIPLCLACGICPDTPRAFFSQQMRWCMGSTTLLTNPDFWRSPLSLMQKICYLSGMMYYSAISLAIFLNPLPGVLMIWVRPDYVRFYNLAFAVPSLIYGLLAIRAWAKASYGLNVQFVMCIQSFAYFTAIKDRLFGGALAWVPSGDTKAHKNHKYRNMRILAWVWMFASAGALIAGVTFQCLRGLPWYDAFPTLLLTAFNFFLAHRFLLCHGKL